MTRVVPQGLGTHHGCVASVVHHGERNGLNLGCAQQGWVCLWRRCKFNFGLAAPSLFRLPWWAFFSVCHRGACMIVSIVAPKRQAETGWKATFGCVARRIDSQEWILCLWAGGDATLRPLGCTSGLQGVPHLPENGGCIQIGLM